MIDLQGALILFLIIAPVVTFFVAWRLAIVTTAKKYFVEMHHKELGLEKAALNHTKDLKRLHRLVYEARSTAITKSEVVVYVEQVDGVKIFSGSDRYLIKFWVEIPNTLDGVEIVLDATRNDGPFSSNLVRSKLPSRAYNLEGDFPDYFKLYYTPRAQVLALQLMSPDVMLNHVENLPEFDLEVNGRTIGLIGDFSNPSIELYRKYRNMMVHLDKTVKQLGKMK